jgi:hypothetical protein
LIDLESKLNSSKNYFSKLDLSRKSIGLANIAFGPYLIQYLGDSITGPEVLLHLPPLPTFTALIAPHGRRQQTFVKYR